MLFRSGDADIIIPYVANQYDRTLFRRLVSQGYTFGLNILFNLRIKYYNGYVISRTKLIKKLKIKTNSFAFQTELLIRLLKKGSTYVQIPYTTVPADATSVFRLRNGIGVVKTVLGLRFSRLR